MRVPNLEEMIAQEELDARPDIRLITKLHSWKNRSIGDERLLELCRDAWGTPEKEHRYAGYVLTRKSGAPQDAGYKVYHGIFSILAGRYPGRGSWDIPAVLSATYDYLESLHAGS